MQVFRMVMILRICPFTFLRAFVSSTFDVGHLNALDNYIL